jgi:hypothetical protein
MATETNTLNGQLTTAVHKDRDTLLGEYLAQFGAAKSDAEKSAAQSKIANLVAQAAIPKAGQVQVHLLTKRCKSGLTRTVAFKGLPAAQRALADAAHNGYDGECEIKTVVHSGDAFPKDTFYG